MYIGPWFPTEIKSTRTLIDYICVHWISVGDYEAVIICIYFLVLYRRRMCLNFTSLVSKRFLAKRNYSFGRTINFILASSYGLFPFCWYIWKIDLHCLFYMEGGGGGVHALQYRVAGSPKKSFWHINFLLLLNKLIYLIFRLFSESEYGFVIYF